MQYILDQKEYEKYKTLRDGWRVSATDELKKDIEKLFRQGIREINISENELALLMGSPYYLSPSEYGQDKEKEIKEGEMGEFLGIKLFQIKRIRK